MSRDLLKNICGSISFDWFVDFVLDHKSTILTGSSIIFNVCGIAATYRNSPSIHQLISDCYSASQTIDHDDVETKKKLYLNTLSELAPLVGPIIMFFVASTACSIINHRDNEAKIAALTAALTAARATISEYDTFRQEAKKVLGDEKFKEVTSEVNKVEARKKIEGGEYIVNPGSGKELCYIPYFGKFFANTEDGIKLAFFKVNEVLDPHRFGGKSYGHESRYGREIVTGEDLLCELGLSVKEIPDISRTVGWEAGRVDSISWNIKRDEMNGMSYLIVDLFTMPCNVEC